jgi:hypothetical protein
MWVHVSGCAQFFFFFFLYIYIYIYIDRIERELKGVKSVYSFVFRLFKVLLHNYWIFKINLKSS